MFRTLLFSLLFLSAVVANAEGRVPSRMVSNVYLLAQAGAMLDICAASPDAPSFPAEKARDIEALAGRLTKLVAAIAEHYGDGGLAATYAATKAQIASDPKLRFHVKSNHQSCGDRFRDEMRTYVADNEALMAAHFAKSRLQPPRTRPAT